LVLVELVQHQQQLVATVVTLFSERLLDLVEEEDQLVLATEEMVVQVVADHGPVLTFLDEQLKKIHMLVMDMETMVVNQQALTTEEQVAAEQVL
jgi:hypothetical protein